MTPHEGVLSYWVPYCFLRVVKYQQGQCFTSKEPVEVVFASTHRALAERLHEWEITVPGSTIIGLRKELADAQERVKALEELMHRATVQHVTTERIAEIRHVLGSFSLEADATPTLADEMDAYARQLEQQLKELEQQRIEYGPICLNCGANKPCMTEEEANKHGGSIPCTFDPAPRELWDRCKRLEQQNAALREALECTLYALENPNSDYLFAINAAKQALATGEEGKLCQNG